MCPMCLCGSKKKHIENTGKHIVKEARSSQFRIQKNNL